MMQYLTFILFAFFGVFANAGAVKLLHMSIQSGQVFGGWQTTLRKLSEKGYGNAAKALGYCEKCFSFWCTVVLFALYFISIYFNGLWVLSEIPAMIFSLGYISFASILSFIFIIKV